MEAYQRYLSWLSENGCIFPSVGMSDTNPGELFAIRPIEPMKAFIFISNAVIITTTRAKNSELAQLLWDPMFVEHPEAENFTIYVFLMWERLKGESGFWHPYFETAQIDALGIFWSQSDLDQLHDQDLVWDIGTERKKYLEYRGFVLRVLSFAQEFADTSEAQLETLYDWAYTIVSSRAFASELPSSMIIPLADNLNHGNVNVSFELTHRSKIKSISFGTDYTDFTNEKLEPTQPKTMKNRTFKNRLQKYTDSHKVRKLTNVWELDNILTRYRSSTDEEDNDTSSNEEPEEMKVSSESEEESAEEEEDNHSSSDEELTHPNEYEWYHWSDNNAYIVIKTGISSSFVAGKPLFYSYGKRTNAFLLKHYGFCLANNVYDSLKVKAWADNGDLNAQPESNRLTEYRFKKTKLNELALEYFRIKVLRKAPSLDFKRTTSPFDSRVEHAVCLHFRDLLEEIGRRFTTTLEEDETLLKEENLPPKLRFAILYRLGQKKIWRAQQALNEHLLSIILRLKAGEPLHLAHFPADSDQYVQLFRCYPLRNYLRKYNGNLILKTPKNEEELK